LFNRPFDTLALFGDILLAFGDVSVGLDQVLAFKFCHRPFPHSSFSSRYTAGASRFFILSQSGERPDASEQGVYQHPEQRSEANQSAEYGDN
jgi:hypothetical protein